MRSLFVTLLLLFWGQGYAEQIFLLYDGACGARLRYDRTVDGTARMDYFSYSLPAGFGMRLVLETDGEGAAVRSELPEDVLRCSDARLTADLADRINGAQDHLFLVQPLTTGGYRVEPVIMAAVLEEMGTQVRYRSPLAAFAFDTDNSVIGVNLDSGNEGATVTFEGMEGQGCQASYLLRQTHPGTAFPAILYRLVPGLGIVERQFTGDGRTNHDEVITATAVDDLSLSAYLDKKCVDKQREATFIPLYIDTQAATDPAPVAVAQVSSPAAKVVDRQTQAAPEEAAAAAVTVHEVARGETLYGIARRYGVSVDEIKRNNGLYDNTIFVGQRLRISSGPDYPSSSVPETGSTYNPPVRVPERETPRPDPIVVVPEVDIPPAATPPSVNNTAGFHVVQPGETFASLALRYGYTTQRFKAFNNLSDAQVAQVGQRLKTSDCDCPSAGLPPVPTVARPTGSGAVVVPPPPRPSDYVPDAPEPAPARPDYPVSYPPPPVVAPSPNVIAPPARPVEQRPQSAAPAYGSPPPPAYGAPLQQNRAIHIVQEGESLYGIARQYRITVEDLRGLNALEAADVIVPYQKLYVN